MGKIERMPIISAGKRSGFSGGVKREKRLMTVV
ncbi:MAG: hypothetical protein BWX50_00718 [Euryarchaeota archaeon ADurb.Bin009]|nr:MAG: hypothetical protein BWX50_00718 [Euryarchaeota archaeon ADurb.Bin009]